MMRFPTLAAMVVLLLVAGACGSDDGSSTEAEDTATAEVDSSEDAESTATATETVTQESSATEEESPSPTATEVPLTASFRGVTADTITLGISMLDFESLVSSGLSTEGWGDQQLVWETYIDDLNANGGILGRDVVAVYDKYNPVGTAEAEAACLRLTEDNEIFAVLGGFLGPAAPATTCIVGDKETLLVGDGQNSERLAQARAPWIQSGSDRERRQAVFLDLLEIEGMLEGARVAVVGGPEAEAEFEAAPGLLAEHGIEPVVVAFNEATSGDILAEDAGWEPIAERIRAEGADTVMLIGSTPGGIRNIRRAGLDVEIWVVDPEGLANLGASLSPEEADGAITVSGVTDIEAWDSPLVMECRDIFSAANPDVELISPADIQEGEEQWFNPIMAYCRWLRLFVMVAEAAGPDLTYESFAAAVETFDQFELPGMPFGSFGPGKTAANDSFRLSVFDATASDTGDLVPLTDIIDSTP